MARTERAVALPRYDGGPSNAGPPGTRWWYRRSSIWGLLKNRVPAAGAHLEAPYCVPGRANSAAIGASCLTFLSGVGRSYAQPAQVDRDGSLLRRCAHGFRGLAWETCRPVRHRCPLHAASPRVRGPGHTNLVVVERREPGREIPVGGPGDTGVKLPASAGSGFRGVARRRPARPTTSRENIPGVEQKHCDTGVASEYCPIWRRHVVVTFVTQMRGASR